MHTRKLQWVIVAAALVLVGYFGVYFAGAKSADDDMGHGLHDDLVIEYRLGPVSLSSIWWAFEPARMVDELLVRPDRRGRTSVIVSKTIMTLKERPAHIPAQ